MTDFTTTIAWLQAHSIVIVMASFMLLAGWAYWPSNRKTLEEHGAIPLRDDREGDQ